eukprot:SAG31_NODE_339_length_17487_cov_20.764435_18_plen_99_part_00
MGTAYGLGEEYGISSPENLVKGLAYVRTANPLKGSCKCTDKLYGLLNLVDRINTCYCTFAVLQPHSILRSINMQSWSHLRRFGPHTVIALVHVLKLGS